MELLMTIAVLAALLFFRSVLVFRIRMKAMDIISKENDRRLDTHDPQALLLDYPIMREVNGTGPSQEGMIFDIRGWTLRYFYPDVHALLSGDERSAE
jgi:hypothetical protein